MGGNKGINRQLMDASLPAHEAIKHHAFVNAPWLVKVSDDGSIWTVQGGSGAKGETHVVDFNWVFPDGAKLTDEKNAHFYEMARSYAWLLRLYTPDISAKVHADRVASLITFFYWLRLMNVRSLSSVTKDHVDLFAEKIAFGKEWTLEAPQRLHKYLQKVIANGIELPRNPTQKSLLKRGQIYNAAGISLFGKEKGNVWQTVCKAVLDWLEANGMEEAMLPPLDDILKAQGSALSAMTIQSVHRALMPIEELWIWRHQLPAKNLKVEPFFHGASRKAYQLGVEPKKHPTIPPRLAMRYLSGALTWVLDYAPIITEEVVDAPHFSISQLSERLRGVGLDIEVEQRVHSSMSSRKVNMTRLVEVLSASCFAVIASLTARRLEEVLDIGANCVVEDQDGHYWLKIYIEKTSQRYDQIPIPVAVKKAIECMEEISRTARKKSGDDSIWQVLNGDIRRISPQNHLNDLATLNGSLTGFDIEWKFSAHQFRRFFAILYFWRYEKGDLVALSHHLRHFDLETTKRYITDIEMGKIWKEVEAEWQGEFLRGVVEGSRHVGGKAGDRLNKEIKKIMAHFRRSVDVVIPQRVLQKLQRLSARLGSEFRQHVWGTICACPKNTKFAEHAKCKGSEKTGPVFKNASESSCADCPFAIHTERFTEAAVKGIESRKATVSCCDDKTILSELATIQIVSLEKVINNGQVIPPLPEGTDG